MLANRGDARDLVKQIIKERLAEKTGVQDIVYMGEEVNITKGADGTVRFNLPRLYKSFVLMSGRLYERQFTPPSEKPVLDENPPSLMVEQLSYDGTPEKVNMTDFKNRIVCPCGNVRWVRNADLFQVKKCKPCTARERKERRRKGNRLKA